MYRIVTVSREYGSGGAAIARQLAERLGWQLLDRAIVEAVARHARVEPRVAEERDERAEPWIERLAKVAWTGGLEGIYAATASGVFDADAMARFTRQVIEEAAGLGSCVVVGRGAQCVLQTREDCFHAFIYAPAAERVQRVRARIPASEDPESVMQAIDRERAGYVRQYFEQDWKNPHLYHLMICSGLGEPAVVETILGAMRASENLPRGCGMKLSG